MTSSSTDDLMRDVATLLEALPYIREFHGTTVVIKYGGAAMEDPELREEFARDVVLLKYVGMNPIVVHGGGPDITAYMKRLGMPVEFVGGLRVSDEATVEIAKMVLVGKVNKEIVLRIGRHGQPAVGLCGDDGVAASASPAAAAPGGEDIGFVGRIERVDVGVISHIASDYIPVIASVGADREGNSYNVNADEAAGAVARALGAYKVIFLTDVRGWLRDPADPDEPDRPGHRRARSATRSPALDGGMRPKLAGLRRGDRRRRRRRAHHRRARRRTRCCSSSSPTPGIGTKIDRRDARRAAGARGARALTAHLRALPGRVRARRGRAAVGRRRQRVPRLPLRHLGLERRPLPSARSSRRSASRRGG